MQALRTKWGFRNEPSQDFSVVTAIARKSSWKPPLGHSSLEVFLSLVESELFKIVFVILIFVKRNGGQEDP